MNSLVFCLYSISVLIYNLKGMSVLFYASFVLALIIGLKQYNKLGDDYILLEIIIYSIIIPNNYIVILTLLVVLIIKIKLINLKIKTLDHVIWIFLFIYVFLNILFNEVNIINALYYVVYFAPLFLSAIVFNTFNIDDIGKEKIYCFLKYILILQGVGILSKLVFSFSSVIKMIDFDWVTGTFGEFQGNILFFFCAFCFVYFINRYIVFRKDLLFVLLSGIYMIMTGSIALIVLFLVSIIIYLFTSSLIKSSTKFRIVSLLGIAACFFIIVTPTWIKNYMVTLINTNDKSVYISKLNDYNSVYFNPDNTVVFDIFGTGIGEYSSRAALTCTGLYIDSYNNYFEPSISEYTEKYIYNKLKYVYDNRLGTLDTPFSEFISIKGELGIVGILFLLYYFWRLFKKNNSWSRVYICLLFFTCFLENYLEFAKVVVLLYMIIILLIDDKSSNKLVYTKNNN